MKKLRILNLYSGIGGNRKLWTPNGNDHEITAIENNPEIAKIYSDFFPNDKMIITDAHDYLLNHYKEYDIIWGSPPCPTHSQMGRLRVLNNTKHTGAYLAKAKYPNMKLYEEILLLKHYFKGKYIIENVIGYYEPLITPIKIGRHYFWCNFKVNILKIDSCQIEKGKINEWEKKRGFDLSNYKNIDKRLILRNCVDPELGLHMLNRALEIKEADKYGQSKLFNE